jgi:hypothetical protein
MLGFVCRITNLRIITLFLSSAIGFTKCEKCFKLSFIIFILRIRPQLCDGNRQRDKFIWVRKYFQEYLKVCFLADDKPKHLRGKALLTAQWVLFNAFWLYLWLAARRNRGLQLCGYYLINSTPYWSAVRLLSWPFVCINPRYRALH